MGCAVSGAIHGSGGVACRVGGTISRSGGVCCRVGGFVESVDYKVLLTALAFVLRNKSLGLSDIVAVVADARNLRSILCSGLALAALILRNWRLGAVAHTRADLGNRVDHLIAAALRGLIKEHVSPHKDGSSIQSLGAITSGNGLAIDNGVSAAAIKSTAVGCWESLAEGRRRVGNAASAVEWVNTSEVLIQARALAVSSKGDIASCFNSSSIKSGAVADLRRSVWRWIEDASAIALLSGGGSSIANWCSDIQEASWLAAWAGSSGSVSLSQKDAATIWAVGS